MTNGDKIRSMTDEELQKWLCSIMTVECCDSKKVRKCIAYGGLHSQKADWAKRWPACGLYGKAVPQQMISDTAKQIFSRIGIRYDDWEFQVDGQISMEAMQNEN